MADLVHQLLIDQDETVAGTTASAAFDMRFVTSCAVHVIITGTITGTVTLDETVDGADANSASESLGWLDTGKSFAGNVTEIVRVNGFESAWGRVTWTLTGGVGTVRVWVITGADNTSGTIIAEAATHAVGEAVHTPSTLAAFNTKISDATLDDAGDPRDPNAHATTHQNGGGDEINVAGLSGELADPQPVKAHGLAGADHNADTLANLNAKITDATLIDTGDSRLSDKRTASAIGTTGADVVVDTAAPPTTGQVLKATSPTTATWQADNNSGDVVGPASATDSAVALFDGATGKLIKNSVVTVDGSGNVTTAGTVDGVDVSAHDHSGAGQGGTIALSSLSGTIDDTQHGSRGGGTLHANAVPAGAAGFMTGADKTKLDGIAAGAQPGDVVGPASATDDRIAAFDGATGKLIKEGSKTATEVGTHLDSTSNPHSTTAAQVGAPPNARTLTAGAGLTGGGDLSADRTFDVGANPDGSIVVAADTVGVGVLASDAQHGIRGGGTQHALAIASGAAGFMSGADKAKLNNVPTGGGLRQSTAAEITVDTTTTSATFVSLLSAPITIAAGGILLISFTVGATNDTKDTTNFFRVLVDGVAKRGTSITTGVAGTGGGGAIALRVTGLAAGARSVTAEWRTDGGTARIRPVTNPGGAHATLLVQEVGA